MAAIGLDQKILQQHPRARGFTAYTLAGHSRLSLRLHLIH